MKKLLSPRTYSPSVEGQEDYTGQVSLTVPDETFTIRELMTKYASGVLPKPAPYLDDVGPDDDGKFEDMDPSKMKDADLHDIELAAGQLKEDVNEKKRKLRQQEEARRARLKAEKAEQEELLKEIRARKELKEPPKKGDVKE